MSCATGTLYLQKAGLNSELNLNKYWLLINITLPYFTPNYPLDKF